VVEKKGRDQLWKIERGMLGGGGRGIRGKAK